MPIPAAKLGKKLTRRKDLMEASDLGQTTDPPAFAIVVTIVKTSHIVAEYNIASGSIATESKQIANAMQTKRQMKTGAVIEDVVPSLTDTRIHQGFGRILMTPRELISAVVSCYKRYAFVTASYCTRKAS